MDIKDLEKALDDVLNSPEDTELQERYCDSIVEYLSGNERAEDILPIVIQGIDIDRAANYFDYLETATNSELKNLCKKLRNDETIKEASSINVLKFLSGLLMMSFIGAGDLGNHFGRFMLLLVEWINSPKRPIKAKRTLVLLHLLSFSED